MRKRHRRLDPAELYGELFVAMHESGLWEDGKSISDATPIYDPETILDNYDDQKFTEGFDLMAFYLTHFSPVGSRSMDFESDQSMSVSEHIERLWPLLTRQADEIIEGSSLLNLPNPYIVPGGRFNEVYYWDSYFTMLGLEVSGKTDLIKNMIDNFVWQLDTFGLIPNGNRTYYLGRSQPPFFALMVDLLAQSQGDQVYIDYSKALLQEYYFWMDTTYATSDVDRHVVRMGDTTGELLNRYFDRFDTPRPEMYSNDTDEYISTTQSKTDFYHNIRAAAESGWDFSARWMDESQRMRSIQTSDIVPVDLNCLLYFLECTIAKAFTFSGEIAKAKRFESKALRRKELIHKYCWNEEIQFFSDYNHNTKSFSNVESLAAVYPLFFNLATDEQADLVAHKLESKFLKPGGLITTNINSGEQWDAPNGWAPLQWMAFKGLVNYGFTDLAHEVRTRWLSLNEKVFKDTGKMLEKYNVEDIELPTGGGEYPVQDGFGWTNGVYLKLQNFKEIKNDNT